MNRIICLSICAFLFLSEGYAQENGLYQITRVDGRIVNQTSGKELKQNEQVCLQTMLLFGSASDKAVLRSPSKKPYRLESSGKLLMSSEKSLIKIDSRIDSRPVISTGLRSGSDNPVTPEWLQNYFGADTFAIIGSCLKIDVNDSDVKKYDLVFRFVENNTKRDVNVSDFVIRQSDMGGRTQINDCCILLREGDQMTKITQITLCFIDEQALFNELAAWLNGLEIKKSGIRVELQQYCRDVYGVMDDTRLNTFINDKFINETPQTGADMIE